MKKTLLLLSFLFVGLFVFAQTETEDINVPDPNPGGGGGSYFVTYNLPPIVDPLTGAKVNIFVKYFWNPVDETKSNYEITSHNINLNQVDSEEYELDMYSVHMINDYDIRVAIVFYTPPSTPEGEYDVIYFYKVLTLSD